MQICFVCLFLFFVICAVAEDIIREPCLQYGLGKASAMAFAPNGQWIVTGSETGSIHIWEASPPKFVAAVNETDAPISDMDFTSDSQNMYAVSDDGDVLKIDMANPAQGSRIKQFSTPLTCINLSRNGKLAAVGTRVGKLYLIPLDSKEETVIQTHAGRIHSLQFRPESQAVAVSGSRRIAEIFDITTGFPIQSFYEEKGVIYQESFEDSDTLPLGWMTSISSPWVINTEWAADGLQSLQVGDIENTTNETYVEFSVSAKEDSYLSYHINTEQLLNPDHLRIHIDGELQNKQDIQGEAIQFVPITMGEHTIRLTYIASDMDLYGYIPPLRIDRLTVSTKIPDQNLNGHAVAFSNDGSRLYTGSSGTLRVWDVGTGELINRRDLRFTPSVIDVHPPADEVENVHYPNSLYLGGYRSEESHGIIMDEQTLETHADFGIPIPIPAPSISDDGQLIAVMDYGFVLRIYNLDNLRPVSEFPKHHGSVQKLTVANNGGGLSSSEKVLFSFGKDGSTKIWNEFSGENVKQFGGRSNGIIYNAALSKDGLKYAINRAGTVRVHSAVTDERIAGFRCSFCFPPFPFLEFSPDGTQLFMNSESRLALDVFDVETRDFQFTLSGHSGSIRGTLHTANYSQDGTLIATVGDPSNIFIWDAETGQQLQNLYVPSFTNQFHTVLFSSDNRAVVAATNQRIHIIDLAAGSELLVHQIPDDWRSIISLDVSPDNQKIAVGLIKNNVHVLDTFTGEILYTFTGHTNSVDAVVFADNHTVISGDRDGVILKWCIPSSMNEWAIY